MNSLGKKIRKTIPFIIALKKHLRINLTKELKERTEEDNKKMKRALCSW
jgi:hypothetical protein